MFRLNSTQLMAKTVLRHYRKRKPSARWRYRPKTVKILTWDCIRMASVFTKIDMEVQTSNSNVFLIFQVSRESITFVIFLSWALTFFSYRSECQVSSKGRATWTLPPLLHDFTAHAWRGFCSFWLVDSRVTCIVDCIAYIRHSLTELILWSATGRSSACTRNVHWLFLWQKYRTPLCKLTSY